MLINKLLSRSIELHKDDLWASLETCLPVRLEMSEADGSRMYLIISDILIMTAGYTGPKKTWEDLTLTELAEAIEHGEQLTKKKLKAEIKNFEEQNGNQDT